MALLSFRATLLPWCSLSPAELLFGRKINTDLPQSKSQLTPHWLYLEDFCKTDKKYKAEQQRQYNSRHRVRPLPLLISDDPVWIRTGDKQMPGRVITPSTTPRSYIISTSTGQVRRNRYHLTPRQETHSDSEVEVEMETPPLPAEHLVNQPTAPSSLIQTCSQTGTMVRPPSRFT